MNKPITAEESDIRLDKFLSKKSELTRTKIKKMIEQGLVEVNGEKKSAHYKVAAGDKIIMRLSEENARKYEPENHIALNILYENDSITVINKPPDLVVHPAPSHHGVTLLDGLAAKYGEVHLVHRLDKDTSGVMIAALNEKTALEIRKQFKAKEVKKVYQAIVDGVIEDPSGEISAPIKRSRRDPTKMRVGWDSARSSVTRYKVNEKLNNATFVEVYPLSGRTHQIRVHFAYSGHPVVGDKKYGKDRDMRAGRQMLHAHQIAFKDPETGEILNFRTEPPQDFQNVLKKLKA